MATEWYVCPSCDGEGIKIMTDPRAPWKRHKELCPRCNGNRMVELDTVSKEAMVQAPIRRCQKCLNWYAIGAGHPADETNDPLAVSPNPKAHTHWHDMSFYAPPGFVDELIMGTVVGPTVEEYLCLKQELEATKQALHVQLRSAEFAAQVAAPLYVSDKGKKAAKEKAAAPA